MFTANSMVATRPKCQETVATDSILGRRVPRSAWARGSARRARSRVTAVASSRVEDWRTGEKTTGTRMMWNEERHEETASAGATFLSSSW